MKKLFLTVIASLALALNGCASTTTADAVAPSSRPQMQITKLAMTTQDGTFGFNLHVKVSHHSAGPLEVLNAKFDIFLNNKVASDYTMDLADSTIPANQDVELTMFVPANVLTPATLDSLTGNKMLMVNVSAAMILFITDDEDLKNLNPAATYEGLVGYEL